MINYEKYAIIRNSKGLKDSDIAKRAGIYQSVLTDWKQGKSIPKYDKMQKIAEALEMDYFAFVGPVGKFSSLNPNRLTLVIEETPEQKFDNELLRLYHNATPDAQKSVMTLLENSQKETSVSSKEA